MRGFQTELFFAAPAGWKVNQNSFTPTAIKAAVLLGNTAASVWSCSLLGRVARMQSDKRVCHAKVKHFSTFSVATK